MSQAQHEDRDIILTGGNDNCVACWDVRDPEMSSIADAARSDGKNTLCQIPCDHLIDLRQMSF